MPGADKCRTKAIPLTKNLRRPHKRTPRQICLNYREACIVGDEAGISGQAEYREHLVFALRLSQFEAHIAEHKISASRLFGQAKLA
ncbi:hypothetical protein [Candidatus Ferrigenium straubiae]|jgi:hypothetical protein|uniref:hypothetical protein n=1 Tax=Candidatus Ferrigenium straubiae TaxID=2919506 RepID=UPI003F4AC659